MTGSKRKTYRLYYSTTLCVKLKCNMEFDDFPFDDHRCPVILSSLRNPKIVLWKMISVKWKKRSFEHPEFDCFIESKTKGANQSAGRNGLTIFSLKLALYSFQLGNKAQIPCLHVYSFLSMYHHGYCQLD